MMVTKQLGNEIAREREGGRILREDKFKGGLGREDGNLYAEQRQAAWKYDLKNKVVWSPKVSKWSWVSLNWGEEPLHIKQEQETKPIEMWEYVLRTHRGSTRHEVRYHAKHRETLMPRHCEFQAMAHQETSKWSPYFKKPRHYPKDISCQNSRIEPFLRSHGSYQSRMFKARLWKYICCGAKLRRGCQRQSNLLWC